MCADFFIVMFADKTCIKYNTCEYTGERQTALKII